MRQVERQYNQNKIIQIEQVCNRNPRKFWNQIKNLRPRSNNKISNKVRDPEGNITTDPECVLDKWKTEFENLYNEIDTKNFDNDYLDESKTMLNRLENEMTENIPEINNFDLNTDIH